MKLLSKGAEASILLSKDVVIKDRIPKSYRIQILDNKLRKSRTKKEAKLLEKAGKLIPIPKLIKTDNKEKIEMEYIKGQKLSEHLDSLKNAISICKTIGKQIAKLHDAGIIHGDLTTSNMILSKKKKAGVIEPAEVLYFIDFGLGFHSDRIEDKAVDLHLIKQALEAKHFEKHEKFFNAITEGYEASEKVEEVLNRLKKVESRGRYKKK